MSSTTLVDVVDQAEFEVTLVQLLRRPSSDLRYARVRIDVELDHRQTIDLQRFELAMLSRYARPDEDAA